MSERLVMWSVSDRTVSLEELKRALEDDSNVTGKTGDAASAAEDGGSETDVAGESTEAGAGAPAGAPETKSKDT